MNSNEPAIAALRAQTKQRLAQVRLALGSYGPGTSVVAWAAELGIPAFSWRNWERRGWLPRGGRVALAHALSQHPRILSGEVDADTVAQWIIDGREPNPLPDGAPPVEELRRAPGAHDTHGGPSPGARLRWFWAARGHRSLADLARELHAPEDDESQADLLRLLAAWGSDVRLPTRARLGALCERLAAILDAEAPSGVRLNEIAVADELHEWFRHGGPPPACVLALAKTPELRASLAAASPRPAKAGLAAMALALIVTPRTAEATGALPDGWRVLAGRSAATETDAPSARAPGDAQEGGASVTNAVNSKKWMPSPFTGQRFLGQAFDDRAA